MLMYFSSVIGRSLLPGEVVLVLGVPVNRMLTSNPVLTALAQDASAHAPTCNREMPTKFLALEVLGSFSIQENYVP